MKSEMQENRAVVLKQNIPFEHMSFLELGAQAAPTLLKEEANILFLDYETKEESCSKNFTNSPEMHDMVVDTDILVKSDDYYKFTKQKFDCVIANHVIEHATDVIYWLQSISKLLKKNGFVFLAIPDKKYSFDKYRANTTFTHLVTDFLLGGKWSEKEHIIDICTLYDETYVGKEMNPAKNLNREFFAEQIKREPWVGLHRHVFEPETFQYKVLSPVLYSRYLDFEIIFCDSVSNKWGEFYCILKKGNQKVFNTDKFLK